MLTWRSGFQTVGPACAKALRVPCASGGPEWLEESERGDMGQMGGTGQESGIILQ